MKKHTTILVPDKGPVYTATGLCMASSFLGVVKDEHAFWVEIHEDNIKEEHLTITATPAVSPLQCLLTALRRGWKSISHVRYTTTDYAKAVIKYQVTKEGPFREHYYYVSAKDVFWYHMEHWVPMLKEGTVQ